MSANSRDRKSRVVLLFYSPPSRKNRKAGPLTCPAGAEIDNNPASPLGGAGSTT